MNAKEARESTLWKEIPNFIKDHIEYSILCRSYYTVILYNDLEGYDIKDVQDKLKMLGYTISNKGNGFKIEWKPMEEVEVWLARDENYSLYMYEDKPRKNFVSGEWENIKSFVELSEDYFPSIKWEDKEPTKAKITLIK